MQLAFNASRVEQRAKIEVLRIDVQRERRIRRAARVELQAPEDRAAKHSRLHYGYIKLAVHERELYVHLVEMPPVGKRERTDGDLSFGIEILQGCDVDRRVAEYVFRRRCCLAGGGRLGRKPEIGKRQRRSV